MTGTRAMTAQARRAMLLHDDASACATEAGLSHVTDAQPGFTRVRRGRGFSYGDHRGRRVGASHLRRIRELAIPPAWRDVWICPSPRGHLQATGIDDRGRKQYLYHPDWREFRDGITFDRLAVIGSVLPAVRAEVEAQLRRRTVDRDRVLAGMVRLLDISGIRVGNESYERDNHSVGLATLRWSHVTLQGHHAVLSFPAKSGRRTDISVADRPLARLLGELAGPARRRVFRADDRPLRPDDLNVYLSELTDGRVTAKDFRTWRGTVAALTHLRTLPGDRPPSRIGCLAAIDAAALALNNTRAIARAHYVHPGLLEAYRSGSLNPPVRRSGGDHLTSSELDLIDLLPTVAGGQQV